MLPDLPNVLEIKENTFKFQAELVEAHWKAKVYFRCYYKKG